MKDEHYFRELDRAETRRVIEEQEERATPRMPREPYCHQCGARRSQDCGCGEIAENN